MKHVIGKKKPDITSENGWEFVCKNLSGGREYYNKEIPSIAVISFNCTKVYTKLEHNPIARKPYPIDFSVCSYFWVA